MFTPLGSCLAAGYLIAILLLVFGVAGLVSFFQHRSGVLQLIISIFAVIAGVIAVVRPGASLDIDQVVLYMIAIWFFAQGAMSIATAIENRGRNKNWIWVLIIGICGCIVGIYSFAHPVVTALAVGILIGLYFVQAGLDMIFLGSLLGDDLSLYPLIMTAAVTMPPGILYCRGILLQKKK